MTEFSIEEKAKHYDEAIKRAKELLEIGLKDTKDKRVVLSFFPELKESEEREMIEKIIATIHLYYGEPLEDEAKEMIDWLENIKDIVQQQPQWKPSEEMLEALYRAIPIDVKEISEDEMLLDKLYQGLKYGRVLCNK